MTRLWEAVPWVLGFAVSLSSIRPGPMYDLDTKILKKLDDKKIPDELVLYLTLHIALKKNIQYLHTAYFESKILKLYIFLRTEIRPLCVEFLPLGIRAHEKRTPSY